MRRLLTFTLFLAAGCAVEQVDPAGGPCVSGSDCPSGYSCRFDSVGKRVCLLGEVPAPESFEVGDVYFCREVKPLLDLYCNRCHGPDTSDAGSAGAQFRLHEYGSDGRLLGAFATAAKIQESVDARRMPPPGEKLQPSAYDRAVFARWSATGAPQCLPRDAGYLSFSEDVQSIFDRRCTPCHIPGPSGGMSLQTNGRAALVGIRSQCDPAAVRVFPGEPENSALWHKLSGTGCGSRMPLGGPYLGPLELSRVRTWIEQGALDN